MIKVDAELVLGVQKDDVSAFDALYWKYHQPVYDNIVKLVKDSSEAKDILQEVFVKLWQKRHSIDVSKSVAGWLFVISFNLSVSHTKNRLREQALYRRVFNENHAPDDDFMEYERQLRLLETAIGKLSPQKKKIVTLCKLEGKTYEEAANELNISRHTVKEYLSSAMVNLNDYLHKNSANKNLVVILTAFLMMGKM
jgi:RNA polymerase sigma-70 factor (ECF subfamily)